MTVRVAAAFVLSCSLLSVAAVRAQSSPTRYISDETAITLREDKGMSAPVAALLKSGTKVELLEEDSASGYARVRVAPGREGWVLARYLSPEPAAREKLAAAQSQIAEQQAQVRKLENEVARLREAAAVSGARTPPAIAPPAESDDGEDAETDRIEASDSVVMFTGAALFVAGLLAGLLIPMLQGTRPRRRPAPEL